MSIGMRNRKNIGRFAVITPIKLPVERIIERPVDAPIKPPIDWTWTLFILGVTAIIAAALLFGYFYRGDAF